VSEDEENQGKHTKNAAKNICIGGVIIKLSLEYWQIGWWDRTRRYLITNCSYITTPDKRAR
jgi:hypothetical protein